jgi:AraC-like DNA-binding protein
VKNGTRVKVLIMNTSTHVDTLSLFIFIGVFQGIVLSLFFIIKSSPNREANRFQGLLLLSLSLCILEQLLNLTGYIVKVLPITNSTEPLNLAIGPCLYLFIKRSLDQSGSKKEWIHFILFFLYLGYNCLDLVQPDDFKYNSYVNSFHPGWPLLEVHTTIPFDPLGLKQYLNLITAIQILFYISIAMGKLVNKAGRSAESIFRTNDDILKSLRNTIYHVFIIILIFILVKLNFKGDVGDYLIGMYVSVFTLLTTYRVMNDSAYFDRSTSFMDLSIGKYLKSSLTGSDKQRILGNIIFEFETKQYFSDNLASLSDLAKKIGESPHHVSQVINEKLDKSFFELLATYRVVKAKEILTEDTLNNLTVEEISEMVGYNSKTAFNNAFKKLSGKTPSEFRKSVTS